MSGGLLDGFFRIVDPILDDLDPMHNKVQTWTTGSSTTEGQSPYFQAIAPIILDAFLPGVGSAVNAADGASTGNWTKAGLSALAAYGSLGSLGSAASSGEGAATATSGLGSTAGDAAGVVEPAASAGSGASSASGFSSGDLGSGISANSQSGLSATSQNAYGGGLLDTSYAAPVADTTYAGVGAGSGIAADSTASASQLAQKANAANSMSNYGKLAAGAGQIYLKQAQSAQEAANQRAMMQQAAARQAMGSADAGTQAKPASSFQTISPYSQFNGGYKPRAYGANVRKQNYGLLG